MAASRLRPLSRPRLLPPSLSRHGVVDDRRRWSSMVVVVTLFVINLVVAVFVNIVVIFVAAVVVVAVVALVAVVAMAIGRGRRTSHGRFSIAVAGCSRRR